MSSTPAGSHAIASASHVHVWCALLLAPHPLPPPLRPPSQVEVHNIARELLRGEFSTDMPLMEAGLDSFGVIEFHSRLSRRLGAATLPETLLFDHPTLRQLESYVSSKVRMIGVPPNTAQMVPNADACLMRG